MMKICKIPSTTKSNTNIRYNIFLAGRMAIKSLANDKSVVIKEADIGGSVVSMDRGHYKTIVETLILDKE